MKKWIVIGFVVICLCGGDLFGQATMGPPPGYLYNSAGYLYLRTGDSVLVWANGTDSVWATSAGLRVTEDIEASGFKGASVTGASGLDLTATTGEINLMSKVVFWGSHANLGSRVALGGDTLTGFVSTTIDTLNQALVVDTGVVSTKAHAENYADTTADVVRSEIRDTAILISDADSLRGKPITQAAKTDNYILKWDAALDSFMYEADVGAAGGETNTLVDTGTFNEVSGFGLAQTKVGSELRIRGLIEGSNITFTASGDTAWSIASSTEGAWTITGDTAYLIDADNDTLARFHDDDLGNVWWRTGADQSLRIVVDTLGIGGDVIKEFAGTRLSVTAGNLNVDLTGALINLTTEVTGVLPDGNVTDNITASNYLPLVGGALSGSVTIAASSTFDGKDVSTLTDIGQTVESAEITNGTIAEVDMKVVNAPNDEEVFTFETTTGDFEWQTIVELLGLTTTDNLPQGATNKYDQALPDSANWSTAYAGRDTSLVLSEAYGGADKVYWLSDTLFTIVSGGETLRTYHDGTDWVFDAGAGLTKLDSVLIGSRLYLVMGTDTVSFPRTACSDDQFLRFDSAADSFYCADVPTGWNWADSSGEPPFWTDSATYATEAADADTAGTKLRAGLNTRLKLSGGTMTGSLVGIDSLNLDSGLYISDDITITGTVDGVNLSVFAATLDDDAEVATEAEVSDSLDNYLREDSLVQFMTGVKLDPDYFDSSAAGSLQVKYADSSGAIPSTEDFHIWGNAYISGQLDQQQHKHRIDSVNGYCTWPSTYLKLPQFYSAWDVDDSAKCVDPDSSHALHPAIIYCPEGKWKHTASGVGVDTVSRWNTHWLGYGPICASENDENPHIAVSEDGETFHEFYVGPDSVSGVGYYDSTLHNPVYDKSDSLVFHGDAWSSADVWYCAAAVGHLSDQDLFLDLDGNMYMPYRMTWGEQDSNAIAIGRTTDGLNWDTAKVILAEGLCFDRGDSNGTAKWDFMSPSFLNDTSNTFEMWCVEKGGQETTWVAKFESPQWDSAWRLVDTCIYHPFNANGRLWHLKVLRHGVDELIALVIEDDTSGVGIHHSFLALATSYDDGMTWTATDSLLAAGSDDWNSGHPYRVDGIWVNKGGYEVIEAYISSNGSHGWAICRTDIKFIAPVDTTDGALTTYVTGVANDTGDVIRTEIKGEIRDTIDIVVDIDSGNISANGISLTDINWPSYWVKFNDVYVVKDSTDSVEVSFPVYVPSTHQSWLLTCSTYAASTRSETLTVVCDVPYDGYFDTLCVAYRVSTGSEITHRSLYGPDLSDGTNLADSLYNYADATDLTSTTWTVDTALFGNPKPAPSPGDRMALQLIIQLDNQNDRLHLGWVKAQITR